VAPEPADLLAPLRDDPSRSGIFCDFDGTLADIVDDPERSRPVEGAVDVLADLARAYARVGVVSGRPAAFLVDHLGPATGAGDLLLAGLYGLEVVRDGEVTPSSEAREWRPVVEEATERTRSAAPRGINVEAKGLTLVLHFRGAPDLAADAEALAEQEAADTGLVVEAGRLSFELRPPLDTSKGTVVAEAAAGLAAACFLGDDTGDLTAFDALDDLAADGASTVRVGVRSAEAPDALLRRADLVVDGPTEVVALLRRLVP